MCTVNFSWAVFVHNDMIHVGVSQGPSREDTSVSKRGEHCVSAVVQEPSVAMQHIMVLWAPDCVCDAKKITHAKVPECITLQCLL